MKPAPPVTRIRRLAWITQQFGTDDQDPETREPGKATRRGRRSGDGDRALTWKNLEKRSGEGVGGGREVVCSPLLPLVSFCAIASRTWFRPDPTQTTRVRRQVKITHRNGAGPKAITQLRASEQRRSVGRAEGGDGDGARRSPSSWRRGLGSACLARTDTGNGRFESD